MKNRKLNQWLWKWHFIAGLISLPFVLVLSITGAVYLFNPDVQKKAIATIQDVEKVQKTPISYQKQWEIAKKHMKKQPNLMVLNENPEKGTEFISGRFSGKKSVFVNPYTGEITGNFSPKSTWMYTIRKLHGELLGGKIGTKIIELIASWMVVLILTGIYVWWPTIQKAGGVFTVRFKEGKRTLYRDIHAVTGFWLSIVLLITLAGGFPWTDVFGGNFKWVQKMTNTGYPKTWSGRGLTSTLAEEAISLDKMVSIAKVQNLKGKISVGLPKNKNSTFSVSNRNMKDLDAQKMLHFDQYSGKLIKKHTWSDVGILMKGRMWLMAFHQGQFGGWNWWLMFFVAILLTIMSAAALVSYVYRKPEKKWGVPKVSKSFKVGNGIIALLVVLGIVFPLFGASLLLMLLFEKVKKQPI